MYNDRIEVHKADQPERVVDTGIYKARIRTSTVPLDEESQELPKYVAMDPRKSPLCLDPIIKSSVADAELVIERHESGNWSIDWGDEESCVQSARHVLYLAELIPRLLEQGEDEGAAAAAFHLGRVTEQLAVRRFEPITRTGRKTKASLSRGPDKRRMNAAEKRETLRRDAEEAVSAATADLRKEDKEVLMKNVYSRAGVKLRISARSVRRRLGE